MSDIQIPTPKGCHIFKNDEQLEIHVPFMHHIHWIFVMNAVIWGPIFLWGFINREPHGYTGIVGFAVNASLVILLLVIVIIVFWAILVFFIKQRIVVTKEEITVRTSPISLFTRDFGVEEISNILFWSKNEDWGDGGKLMNYGVMIRQQNGIKRFLVKGLKRGEQARWLKQELKAFLEIPESS